MMKKYGFKILLLIFVLIFVISAIISTRYFLTSSKSKAGYKELEKIVAGDNSEIIADEVEIDEEEIRQSGYKELKAMNNDFFGWIEIEGTKVNYPVMYTEEPEFYLRKNFDKEYSDGGSIFLDHRHDATDEYSNFLVYGHNMNDGTMFADLLKYKKEDYYKEHSIIKFDEIDESHEFMVFAVFQEGSFSREFEYFNEIYYESNYAFKEFIKTLRKKSLYDTKVVPKYTDRLLMLSTCETTAGEGRFVVVAKEI